ncbi:preprotein translocase subunit YajC [Acidaminococcus sp.]|uniref:preprotein translocase subunit YajC n=1 Tax=Acidaminococcus sp. TaxID=1872103 RepID=UPI003AB8C20B
MENIVQMAWPFILMGVIFYFMIYRPQKRDQKKRANMLDSLKVGTRIVTIGGIFGEIAKIKDDRIRIKVAEDVEIWIRRAAVGTVITTELQKAAKEDKAAEKVEETKAEAAEEAKETASSEASK